MLTSLNQFVKIPIAFYFPSTTTAGGELKDLINDILSKLFSINLRVHLVVCDQGTSNQSLRRKYNINIDQSFFNFEFEDKLFSIFFIYDIPHVIKAIRNNLIKYDLVFVYENIVYRAKWKHVVDTFNYFSTQNVSMIPKVAIKHVYPSNFQKMTVSLAVQVFSNSMSSAIKLLVDDKVLEPEAIGTSILCKIINNMFDILNNKSSNEDYVLKQDNLAYSKLKNYLLILDTFEFDRGSSNLETDSNIKKKKVEDCIYNLRLTIHNILDYVVFLKNNYSIEFVITNRLNQDSLENFFSLIRNQTKEAGNLRVNTFRQTYRCLLYSSFFKRKLNINKNCIDTDFNQILMLPTNKAKEIERTDSLDFSYSDDEDKDDESEFDFFFLKILKIMI